MAGKIGLSSKGLGAMLVAVAFGLGLLNATSASGNFDLASLPKSKSVTLPPPAATLIPLPSKVELTATDNHQVLKLTAYPSNKDATASFTVMILDPRADQPERKITVRPGHTVMYSFKSLGAITLKAEKPSGKRSPVKLKVESNRPLGIGH
jgi:hypothetical protein